MAGDRGLQDDVVVLAGGTGRVGGAAVAKFVRSGARVVLVSREPSHARAVAAEVAAAAPERVAFVGADLALPADGERAIEEARSRFGRIDAVVSLAGGGTPFVPIAEANAELLALSVRNNLEVAFNLMVPALNAMLAQDPKPGARSRGRLVAVTAGSSLDPQPRFGLMGIGKAGVNLLMRAIAREHKADGIVANSIVMGGVATEAARGYLSPQDFAAAASPEEVAEVLAFHASDASTGINGELIHLNAREVD